MSRKALFVDDEESDIIRAQRAITNLHFEPYIADNLSSAEEILLRDKPDVAFVDIGIPIRKDGPHASFDQVLDFVRRFRSQSAMIMLTGNQTPSFINEAFDAGCCGFILKSMGYDPGEFERKVKNALALYEATMSKDAQAPDILRNQALLLVRLEAQTLQLPLELKAQTSVIMGQVRELLKPLKDELASINHDTAGAFWAALKSVWQSAIGKVGVVWAVVGPFFGWAMEHWDAVMRVLLHHH